MFSAGKRSISMPGTTRRNMSHITSWESLAIISTFAFFAARTLTIARVNFPVPAAISKSFMSSCLTEGNTSTRLRRNSTDSSEYSGLPLSYKDTSVVNSRNPNLPASAMLLSSAWTAKAWNLGGKSEIWNLEREIRNVKNVKQVILWKRGFVLRYQVKIARFFLFNIKLIIALYKTFAFYMFT